MKTEWQFRQVSLSVWSVLDRWLRDGEATATDLQRDLLLARLAAPSPSPLLLESLRVVAEATSANWADSELRAAIAQLRSRLDTPQQTAFANGSSTTRSLHLV